jgi:hypothetical protein
MMEEKLSQEIKEEILKLISTPGVEIKDIAIRVKTDYDSVIEFLSEQYLKHDLDYGRRLCCRF